MRTSRGLTQSDLVKLAVERGYVSLPNGEVHSPRGRVSVYLVNGYPAFSLRAGTAKRHVYVRWMVAYTKYGEEVFELGIRHKDKDILNCSERNLILRDSVVKLKNQVSRLRGEGLSLNEILTLGLSSKPA